MLCKGQQKVHGIKFQSISTPSGMIANMYIVPWKESGMIVQCLPNLVSSTSYGSVHSVPRRGLVHIWRSCLPARTTITGPFQRDCDYTTTRTVEQIYMSQVRIAVEWLFGDIVNYFKFLDFKKNKISGL
jgi:hypothetical protein